MERRYYLIIAISFTIAIALGSLVSGNNEIVKHVQFSDKFVHAFAYLLLSMSWLFVFPDSIVQIRKQGFIAFFVLIYGIIIEAIQGMLTTNRQADIMDMLANFVGILLALAIFNIVFRKKRLN